MAWLNRWSVRTVLHEQLNNLQYKGWRCWHCSYWVVTIVVYSVRNVVAHGDAQEGKWRGNWRMEWVASTLTRPWNVLYPALLTLIRTPRLPAFDWTDSPANLNGLVRLGERWNVVSARVPSGSARALPNTVCDWESKRNSSEKMKVLSFIVVREITKVQMP